MNRSIIIWLLMTLGMVLSCRSQDTPLTMVLVPEHGWEKMASGMKFCDACCTDKQGNFYFADAGSKVPIKRIGLDGKISDFGPPLQGVSGLQFGDDSLLYICQGRARRICVLRGGKDLEVVVDNVRPNDLVVTADNHLYFTETFSQRVYHIDLSKEQKALKIVDSGILKPNGIALTPKGGTLFVSDHLEREVWFFRIDKDNSLSFKAPYGSLRIRGKNAQSKGDGCDVDSLGRYYVCSDLGIQMFDPTARLGGVILGPDPNNSVVSLAFSGEGLRYLYVASGGSIYRRKMKTPGVGR